MSSSPPIEAQDISLRYRLDRANVGTIKEATVRTLRRQRTVESINALDGVSFTVARGEIFGVVGPNGAGKSTLMKVIARVLPPTTGRVIVRGRVAPMIELGSGMNPELTAAENIVLYGALLGRDPGHMRERVPAIVEWPARRDGGPERDMEIAAAPKLAPSGLCGKGSSNGPTRTPPVESATWPGWPCPRPDRSRVLWRDRSRAPSRRRPRSA